MPAIDVSGGRATRSDLCRGLRERSQAEVAMLALPLRSSLGRDHVAEVVVDGHAEMAAVLARLDGVQLGTYDPRALLLSAPNTPIRLRREDLAGQGSGALWAALDASDAIAGALAAEGRVVGIFSVVRRRGSPDFAAADEQRLRRSLRKVAATLLPLSPPLEVPALPEGQLVCDLSGRVLLASGAMAGEQALVTVAAEAVPAFVAGGPVQRVVGARLLMFEHLVGRGGPGVLVRCVAVSGLPVDPLASLPPARRTVARLAADGLTLAAIAAELGRSPETIRSHLKRVYDHFGVASRVELAARLRGDGE